MSTCCDIEISPKLEKKRLCPNCDEKQNLTSYQTVLHQLRDPFKQNLNTESGYYFCRNKDCDTVYFDTDNNVFSKEGVRWTIGQKLASPTRQICYCFDVTYEQIANEFSKFGVSKTKEFVMAQTKAKNCACEIRNPAGKCCLVDFPKE